MLPPITFLQMNYLHVLLYCRLTFSWLLHFPFWPDVEDELEDIDLFVRNQQSRLQLLDAVGRRIEQHRSEGSGHILSRHLVHVSSPDHALQVVHKIQQGVLKTKEREMRRLWGVHFIKNDGKWLNVGCAAKR